MPFTKTPPPAVAQFAQIRAQTIAAANDIAKLEQEERAEYQNTWKGKDKAKFPATIDIGRVVTLNLRLVANPAEGAKISVWELLREGTAVRYMHMTKDFVAKTTPGATRSGPGAGGRASLGKPLPGIEERQQDAAINKETEGMVWQIITRHYEQIH